MDRKNSVNELYKLNPKLSASKKKCIFGTGMHAKQTYVDLSAQGVRIDCFVDREVSGSDASCMGIPLISEEELEGSDASVIIASTAWTDISGRLIRQGITDLYVDLRRYGEVDVQDDYLCSVGKYTMKRNTMYILCPAGIGDTLYIAAFAKAVKVCHAEINKVCLITKESHACIGGLFEGVDEVIASDCLTEQMDLYSIATKTWYLKNYIYGHFKKNLCQTLDSEWYCDTDKNMISFYKRKILKIPKSAEPEKMILPDTGKDRAFQKEKAVVLMPCAATVPLLSIDFWNELADRIRLQGYTVYTNVKDNTEAPIYGTHPLSESIADTAAICSHVHAVIALRSGMCDVLAMTSAPLIILNTDERCTLDWDVTVIRKKGIENLRCYGNYNRNEITNKILEFLEKQNE